MHGNNPNIVEAYSSINVIEKINYWVDNFPWIKLHKTIDIINLTKQEIDNVFAFTWLAWAWKWKLTEKFWKKLGIQLKNKVNDNPNLLELWITHEDIWMHYLYVILDCFFKEIWTKRYTEMLENSQNFLEMFSDDDKAVDFVRNILHNHEPFQYDWVYLKTDIERELSKAMSSLYVRWREEWTNTTIVLDWVNSFKIVDVLLDQIWYNKLNIAKIIIEPKLWLSFQRIIKRDWIWNGKKKTKSFDQITMFRLEESYHLFENFTIPALYDDKAYMIDFTDKTDHELTLQQKKDVITSLIKSSSKLLEQNRWEHFDDYLISYVWLLIDFLNHY